MQQVKITIDKKGNPKFDLKGFPDGSCLNETKSIEEAFGGEVTLREKKPEAYLPPAQVDQQVKIGQ